MNNKNEVGYSKMIYRVEVKTGRHRRQQVNDGDDEDKREDVDRDHKIFVFTGKWYYLRKLVFVTIMTFPYCYCRSQVQ